MYLAELVTIWGKHRGATNINRVLQRVTTDHVTVTMVVPRRPLARWMAETLVP